MIFMNQEKSVKLQKNMSCYGYELEIKIPYFNFTLLK